MSGRFVFVDRDGTLIEDREYTHRVEDYARLPGAAEGLRALAEAGFRIAIVTNQSGIARGYFGDAELARFQAHLLHDFTGAGVTIEAIYHCPHHPDDGCGCRKPATGMLERARGELGADLASSWVIGDAPSDVELARRAGCRVVYLRSSRGQARGDQPAADVHAEDDLQAAARYILQEESK